jgi:hypothetical protein
MAPRSVTVQQWVKSVTIRHSAIGVPHALLSQVTALFQHRADQQRITLSVDAAEALPVLNIDEGRLTDDQV